MYRMLRNGGSGLKYFIVCVSMLVLFLTACTAEELATPEPSSPIENDIADCAPTEEYLEAEMICALPLKCTNNMSCIERGNQLVKDLTITYGSLTDELGEDVEEGPLTVIATYDVDLSEELLESTKDLPQQTLDRHATMWFDFAWLIPEKARTDINMFEVFRSSDTLAHIYMNNPEEVEARWTLGINETEPYIASEKMVTYVHEFSHVVSLRDDQVDYYASEEQCAGFWSEGVCIRAGAYLDDFYTQFYETDDVLYTEDSFVSDYAMVNIEEDFAETFAYFVLTTYPQADRIVDDKIRFFYNYPQFVELRADILRRAATWLTTQ